MENREQRLIAWMDAYVGSGKRFKNLNEWSTKSRGAGKIGSSTLHRIYENGKADPKTLITLARSVGVSPLDLLVQQDVLQREEVTAVPLSVGARDLVDMFEGLAATPAVQMSFLENCKLIARGLRAALLPEAHQE